jgi:hypothetical protein
LLLATVGSRCVLNNLVRRASRLGATRKRFLQLEGQHFFVEVSPLFLARRLSLKKSNK